MRTANFIPPWKDAGVVDRGGLENRCALAGTQGSNPCLSAKSCKSQGLQLFFALKAADENPEGFVMAHGNFIQLARMIQYKD